MNIQTPVNTDQELRELKELKAYRLEHEKYRYYTPVGRAHDFIEMWASDKYFINLLQAANGIGKTRTAVNIMAHLFWPCGNEYFQGKLFQNWPYLKRGRIIAPPKTVTSAIIPEMKDQFPRGRYNAELYNFTKDGKQYESNWSTNNGFVFDIMTYEQAESEFESATLGWVWFDEPPPYFIWKATVSRLRRGGIIMVTETPLAGSAWLTERIVNSPSAKYH